MQLMRLFPAAALAWTASAMLVAPDTSDFTEAEIKMIETLESNVIETMATSRSAVVGRLPCNGCAVAQGSEQDGSRTWDVSGKKMTDLVITISQEGNTVLFGGSPIYGSSAGNGMPLARQIKALVPQDDFEITEDYLTMAIHAEISPKQPVAGQPNMFATQYKIEVLGIDGKVVHVPSLAFAVFDNGNEVTLSQVAIVPTVTTLTDARCQTVVCRVKAQLAAKIMAVAQAVKSTAAKAKTGCMRMMGMHPHGHKHGKHGKHQHQQHEGASIVDRLRGGPNKFKGHHGAHHGMRKPCGRHGIMGRLVHGLVSFTRHVVMPVLIGVAAGMAVSAMAMVLGQIVFMIWMRLSGRRHEGYTVLYQVEQTAEVEQAEEQLPKYEPADAALPPAYVDEKSQTEN